MLQSVLYTWMNQASAMQIPAHSWHLIRTVDGYAAAQVEILPISVLVKFACARQGCSHFCRQSISDYYSGDRNLLAFQKWRNLRPMAIPLDGNSVFQWELHITCIACRSAAALMSALQMGNVIHGHPIRLSMTQRFI